MQELSRVDFSFKKLFIPLTTAKVIAILLSVGFLVFFNSLFNDFVYDDYGQIVNNPLVHTTAYLRYLFTGSTFFDNVQNQQSGSFYRPVLSTIYTLLYALAGPHPFIYHFFQVILHITNSVLVYVLFHKFFKTLLSLFLALIFLVHPINQEAVVYIADLQEPLFFFFGVLSLLISSTKNFDIRKIILANIFLLLGLLSKETAILFVPILFLYTFLLQKKTISRFYTFTILFTTAFYLYFRFFVVRVAELTNPLVPIMQVPLSERFTTMPAIILYYLTTFFFPIHLAYGYAWVVKNFTVNQFFLPLIIDILFFSLIFIFGIFIKKTNKSLVPVYLFFAAWFVIGIMAHMQIIALDATVANRWFYFTILGLLGILGTIFSINWHKYLRKELLISGGLIIILLLSVRTIVRNTNWINALTLCQHDLPSVSDSYVLQSVCGGELLIAGKYEEAKKHYAKAAQIMPNLARSWYEYGLSYEYTKDIEKAREYYRKSILMDKTAKSYVTLAGTYLKYENNPKKAKEIVEEGLKTYPNYQTLQLYLAVSEYRMNNKKKALEIAIQTDRINKTPVSLYVLTQIYNNEEVNLEKIISL